MDRPLTRRPAAGAAALVLAATGLACGWLSRSESSTSPSAADLEGLRKVRDAFVEATNEGDVDRLVALFEDDAVFVPADDPTCEGKDAISDYLDDVMRDTPATIELDVLEIRVEGGWAFERIDATITSSDAESGEETETWARYFWVLKRQPDGSWKIDRAIFNIDEPDDEEDDGGTFRQT